MGLFSQSLRAPECRPAYYLPNVSLPGRSLLPSFCHLLLAGVALWRTAPKTPQPAYYSPDPAPTPSHNTGRSPSPFSLSPKFGRAAPYPWFLGVSHTDQWRPGLRPAHCVSDHAPRPTPFSLSPAFGPAALQRWVWELRLSASVGSRPRPSRPRPPFIQAPPHPRTPGTPPLPQHRKITWGAGRLRYPQLHWARRLHALLPSSSTPDVLLQPSSRHTWSPPILSLSLPLSSPRLLPEAAPWATGGAGLPALSRGPEAGRAGPLRGAAARARLTRAAPGLATRSAQAPLSRQRRSDGWRW